VGTGSVAMVSVMVNAIVVQMCVLPMYQQLKDRTPRKFNSAVTVAFGVLILIFSAYAMLGYFTFGPDVEDNILNALPNTKWGQAARVGAAVCVAGVYPIFEQAMVAPVWNLNTPHRRLFYAIATTATVALIMLGSVFIKTLGFINIVDGALCCICFVSVCPAIVGLFLLDRQSFGWRAAMYALMLFGSLAGIFGMIYRDNYKNELDEHCVWSAGGGGTYG